MTGTINRAARAGAVFYALWGLLHVAGGAVQLATLRGHGGIALTRLIASGRPLDPGVGTVPDAAAAFMGMGAFNILWIGLLVTVVAVTLNRRNSRLGYWLNLGIVGATDLGLLVALLLPGTMAWSDGGLGLGLYFAALVASTLGRMGATRLAPAPA
ncbi:MAG TPA: hypothetical protein VNH46_13010 [Gemmatimonadales bacterium]|nr:hypothetical protein [Gemmatimonadales bacterium]